MAQPPFPPENVPKQAIKGQAQQAAREPTDGSRTRGSYRLVRAMELSPSVRGATELAARHAQLSDGRAALSTSLLLFALADRAEPADRPARPAQLLRTLAERTGHYQAVRHSYLSRKGIPPSVTPTSAPVSDSLPLTAGVITAFRRAEGIAVSTERHHRVHTRHLVAALLHPEPHREPSGALQRLREMGLDPAALRLQLYDLLAELAEPGDLDAWSRVLGAGGAEYVPAFHADTAVGEDLLGISREVAAFARLVAAREVTPPLSIGLFGEWGSGKTFFMNQLRGAVSALARDARNSGRMQRDLPYYKRIVQIEFNAWHYVEGNLWASLVQHVFDNLRIDPDDPPSVTQRLQEGLLRRLTESEDAEREAAEAERAAAEELETAEEHLRTAQRRRMQAERELQEMNLRSARQLFPLPEVQKRLAPLLERLGLHAPGANAAEVIGAIREVRATLAEGTGMATALLRAPDAGRRLFYLAGTLLLATAGTFGVLLLGDAARALSAALATSSVPAAAEWLRRQMLWVRGQLGELREIEAEYDQKLAEALAEHDQQVERLHRRLARVASLRHAAEQRLREARKAVREARRAHEQATSVRLLGSFIQDRAASPDYRRHLGIAALIRNDFEKLSGLIEDDNWCLAPEEPGGRPRGNLRKFASLEEESQDQESRINRIVLYIDDLDRCPPRRVVEVLQAVHLLLAFPLFVVVVGVDARWITRALATRYRELLHREGELLDEDAELIGKASTVDYLEKIFQIPFWLSAMDHHDAARMVGGLLRGSLAPSAGEPGPGAAEGELEVLPHQALPEPAEPVAAFHMESPELEAERLTMHPAELEFMQELAPLLGRSPRALKRFVNVYRLLKASLGPLEDEHFLDARSGAYRAVLFLIAVDTGSPLAAPTVFGALASAVALGGMHGRAIRSGLLDALRDPRLVDGRPEQQEDLQRVAGWLQARSAAAFLEDPDVLSEWLPRVQRYSFHGGRSGAPPLTWLQRPTVDAGTVPPPTA